MPRSQLDLLGALAVAILFENYDQAVLTQAVKQIAADFGLIESQLGNLLGFVRLGAIPAFFLIPFADRIGRRRLFLISVIGMSFATVLAALSQNAAQFIAVQMLSRTFMVTSSATAYVIIAESIAARHRGWGIGILGAVGAFGVGLSAMLFAAIDVLPYGWRAMYLFGVGPLVLLPWLRRRVVETARFTAHREDQRSRGDENPLVGWWRPLTSLARIYPGRTLAVGLIGATSSAGHAAAYNFSSYFVQTVHGWDPGQYSLMLLVAGVGGIIGHPVAGRLADRRGRRLAGAIFYGAFPLLGLVFYGGPSWMVPIAWVPMIFAMTGGSTIARALSTELFPTSYRGTASGWLTLLETLGAAGGLFAVSWLTAEGASAVPAVRIVMFLAVVASVAVLLLPETGQRELEDISSDS